MCIESNTKMDKIKILIFKFRFFIGFMNQIKGIECKNKIFILEFRFSLDY